MLMASTPNPPYYAVIFSSQRKDHIPEHDLMSNRMLQLAQKQKGFLGIEKVSDPNGFDLMISYWDSREAIQNWRNHVTHQAAQQKGKNDWYEKFKTRICRVEHDYEFSHHSN